MALRKSVLSLIMGIVKWPSFLFHGGGGGTQQYRVWLLIYSELLSFFH